MRSQVERKCESVGMGVNPQLICKEVQEATGGLGSTLHFAHMTISRTPSILLAPPLLAMATLPNKPSYVTAPTPGAMQPVSANPLRQIWRHIPHLDDDGLAAALEHRCMHLQQARGPGWNEPAGSSGQGRADGKKGKMRRIAIRRWSGNWCVTCCMIRQSGSTPHTGHTSARLTPHTLPTPAQPTQRRAASRRCSQTPRARAWPCPATAGAPMAFADGVCQHNRILTSHVVWFHWGWGGVTRHCTPGHVLHSHAAHVEWWGGDLLQCGVANVHLAMSFRHMYTKHMTGLGEG